MDEIETHLQGMSAREAELARRIARLAADGIASDAVKQDYLCLTGQAGGEDYLHEVERRAAIAPALREQLSNALKTGIWAAAATAMRIGMDYPWFLEEAKPELCRTAGAMARSGLIAGVPNACAVFGALDKLWPMTGQDMACAFGLGPMRCSIPSRARTHPWEYPDISLDGGIFRWKGRRVAWPACRAPVEGKGTFPSDAAPAASWDVYIDEAGERFGPDEKGEPGVLAAVCIPAGCSLPDLGFFHSFARQEGSEDAVAMLNRLLDSRCPVLGFSAGALGLPGWRACICRLAAWCARLLPAGPKGLRIRIHAERRLQIDAPDGPDLLAETKEILKLADPERAASVCLESFSVEAKGAPMLAWADVPAWSWGRFRRGGWPGFAAAGMAGTCLCSAAPGELEAASDLLAGRLPDRTGWNRLLRRDFQEGSIPFRALAGLKARLQDNGALRREVLHDMESCALRGDDVSVLERFAELAGPGEGDPPFVAFYAMLGEVRKTVQRQEIPPAGFCYGSKMPELPDLPLAAVHAALRRAEAACTENRPSSAERLLSSWDVRTGGRLPDNPQAAARVLGIFGRCEAMHGGGLQAADAFGAALEKLGSIRGPLRRQLLFLRACAASQGRSQDAAAIVQEALGMDWKDAVNSWWTLDASSRRLLARFLAMSCRCGRAGVRWTESWIPAESDLAEGDPALLLFRGMAGTDADAGLRRVLREKAAEVRIPIENPVRAIHAAALKLSLDAASPQSIDLRYALLRGAEALPGFRRAVDAMLASAPGNAFLALSILPFGFLPMAARTV